MIDIQPVRVVKRTDLHLVLLADLVASRGARDRARLSGLIHGAIEAANAALGDALAVPMTLTKGIDELSAVVSDAGRAFDACVELNLALRRLGLDGQAGQPAKRFRFAVAWGEIDVWPRGTRDAGELDGSAFHEAAAALARAKRRDLPFAIAVPDASGAAIERATAIVEVTAAMHQAILDGWTKTETVTALAARTFTEFTQADLASELGVSQQAVSATLRRAKEATLRSAEQAIAGMLVQIDLYHRAR